MSVESYAGCGIKSGYCRICCSDWRAIILYYLYTAVDKISTNTVHCAGLFSVAESLVFMCPDITQWTVLFASYLWYGKASWRTRFIICAVGHYQVLTHAPYGRDNAPWFMCWFRRYINCLFICLLNFLPSLLSSFFWFAFLLIYFLTCLLPDLSIYFHNRPVPFPGRRL